MINELLKNIRELIEELEKLEIDDIENSINETLDLLKKSCNAREYKLAFETFSWIKQIAIENKKALHSQANELQG